MMLEIVSGHMVKWLCCGVAGIASAMCPRSWGSNQQLEKSFFSGSPPDIRHEPRCHARMAFFPIPRFFATMRFLVGSGAMSGTK